MISKEIINIYKTIKCKCSKNNKTRYNGSTMCDEWINSINIFAKWLIDSGWENGKSVYSESDHFSPETCIIIDRKDSFIKNIKKNNLKKYGVEHTSLLKSVIEKRKQTNLKKYGADCPMNSNSIQNNIKKNNIEKYGCEHHLSSKLIIDKRKSTNLERYGVENVFSLKSIQNKIKQDNLKKYGYKLYISTKECKDRIKSTNLKLYGKENVFASQVIKDKIKKSNIIKYGVEHPMKNQSVIQKGLQTKFKNGKITTIDGKFISEIAEKSGLSYKTILQRSKIFSNIDDITSVSKTNIETIIQNILRKNNINFVYNKQVDKFRPDFIIDKIIIEANGLYWHSEINRNKMYHKEKRLYYIQNGFKPLFFNEDEVIEKTNIVESIILNKLNKSSKIHGRKCNIVELKNIDSKHFFEENHLMGHGKGRCFALICNNEIVCAIRIVKKTNGFDISRFCTKLNTSVVGGFSKLIRFIEINLKPAFIETFIDLRYGSGDYLYNLGFVKQVENLSFSWVKDKQRLHRMNFPKNSGYDHGFVKLWDCGQAKFKKIYNENNRI